MKVYVNTTGVLFGLLTIAHILRMVQEPRFATDLSYIAITVVTAFLCLWAGRLYLHSRR